MAKRHHDALLIQQGACNPSGIAHSLVSACHECLSEGVSQREDPAVRLIVHQLAFLCGIEEIEHGDIMLYSKLSDECRKLGEVADA